MASALKYKFVPAHQKIYELGDESDALYMILDGYADVVKPFQLDPLRSGEDQRTVVLEDGTI